MSRLDFLNPEEGDWIQVQDLINAKSSTQAHIFAALRDEILRVESNDSASRLTRDGALRLRWLIEEVQGASYRAEGPLDQGTERAMEDVLVYEVYLESEEGFEQHRIAEPLEFLRRTTERESEARDLINSGADLFR